MKPKPKPKETAKERAKEVRRFWRRFAAAFVAPLRANGELNGFVTNPAVTGAYAEAWVRQLVQTMAVGLRVSTGTIIKTTDRLLKKDLRRLPQADLILWDPTELPALFESGDFALIHAASARGIIEVKRSTSDLPKVQRQLRTLRSRLLSEYRKNVLGVVIAHAQPLFVDDLTPGWVMDAEMDADVRMTRLLSRSGSKPDPDGVFALIYFLSHVVRNPSSDAS